MSMTLARVPFKMKTVQPITQLPRRRRVGVLNQINNAKMARKL